MLVLGAPLLMLLDAIWRKLININFVKSTELSTCSPPLPEHIDEWPRIHAADYVAQVTELGSASSQRASSSAAHAL